MFKIHNKCAVLTVWRIILAMIRSMLWMQVVDAYGLLILPTIRNKVRRGTRAVTDCPLSVNYGRQIQALEVAFLSGV